MKYLDSAVFAARLQPQNAERIRNDHLLLTVVRGRNTFKELETLYRGGTTGGLVGQHATHRFEEDARRRTVMERPRLFGVNNVSFVEEVVVPQLDIYDDRRQNMFQSFESVPKWPKLHTESISKDICAPCFGRNYR